jgi:TetR/AcrR family transcriptional regulator, fatty acid metabolism regulator protein
MKADLRRKQIIECAAKQFAMNGYYHTHVSTILREAKIGIGTFYMYFKNKEDLFISILVKYLDEWEESVQTSLINMSQKDIIGYYQALITQSLKFFKEHADLCNIYLRIGPSVNELHGKYIDLFEAKMVQYVVDDLKRGIKAGFIRKDIDIELMANMMLGAHLRVVYYYFVLKHSQKDLPAIEHITDQFFKLIYTGLHP